MKWQSEEAPPLLLAVAQIGYRASVFETGQGDTAGSELSGFACASLVFGLSLMAMTLFVGKNLNGKPAKTPAYTSMATESVADVDRAAEFSNGSPNAVWQLTTGPREVR